MNRLQRIFDGEDLVAFELQSLTEGGEHDGFVIDDEDPLQFERRSIGGRESHIAGSAFNRPSSFLRITLSSSLLASTSWALSRMRLST